MKNVSKASELKETVVQFCDKNEHLPGGEVNLTRRITRKDGKEKKEKIET